MYLGVDLGTSGVKAVLLCERGRTVQQTSVPLEVSRLHPLWSEQSPQDWWAAAEQAVGQLEPALRAQVRGIGLAGQMHGAVLLDGRDRVLRPAILWNDGRSQAQCAELEAREPALTCITGNTCLAGFTAPKLLWVRQNEPEIFARTRRVLLPKDYLRLCMTGEMWSDMSDASGTLWLDVAARRWSERALTATGLTVEAMPQLCEGTELTAKLSAAVAARWGMERVSVAGGGGDNAAAAVGMGVVSPGEAMLSLGTSGVIFAATDRLKPNVGAAVHAFAHAVPDRWCQMSVMLSATASLDWAARLVGVHGAEALVALAAKASAATPIFLPYLSGERTPHGDPAATAALFGMTMSMGPAEIARAVLDGVALGLRDGRDALVEAGADIARLTVVGGGSRSRLWGGIIAAALHRPLVWREGCDAAPALGAARLGRIAAGDGDVAEVCARPKIVDYIEVDAASTIALDAKLFAFRTTYKSLALR